MPITTTLQATPRAYSYQRLVVLLVSVHDDGVIEVTENAPDGHQGKRMYYRTLEAVPTVTAEKIKQLMWMPLATEIPRVGVRVSNTYYWIYN